MADGSLLAADDAETRFREFAEDTYGRSGEREAHRLSAIAMEIAAFVERLEAHYQRLDYAAHVPAYTGANGIRYEKRPFQAEKLAAGIAEVFGELTLHDSATGLLIELARREAA